MFEVVSSSISPAALAASERISFKLNWRVAIPRRKQFPVHTERSAPFVTAAMDGNVALQWDIAVDWRRLIEHSTQVNKAIILRYLDGPASAVDVWTRIRIEDPIEHRLRLSTRKKNPGLLMKGGRREYPMIIKSPEIHGLLVKHGKNEIVFCEDNAVDFHCLLSRLLRRCNGRLVLMCVELSLARFTLDIRQYLIPIAPTIATKDDSTSDSSTASLASLKCDLTGNQVNDVVSSSFDAVFATPSGRRFRFKRADLHYWSPTSIKWPSDEFDLMTISDCVMSPRLTSPFHVTFSGAVDRCLPFIDQESVEEVNEESMLSPSSTTSIESENSRTRSSSISEEEESLKPGNDNPSSSCHQLSHRRLWRSLSDSFLCNFDRIVDDADGTMMCSSNCLTAQICPYSATTAYRIACEQFETCRNDHDALEFVNFDRLITSVFADIEGEKDKTSLCHDDIQAFVPIRLEPFPFYVTVKNQRQLRCIRRAEREFHTKNDNGQISKEWNYALIQIRVAANMFSAIHKISEDLCMVTILAENEEEEPRHKDSDVFLPELQLRIVDGHSIDVESNFKFVTTMGDLQPRTVPHSRTCFTMWICSNVVFSRLHFPQDETGCYVELAVNYHGHKYLQPDNMVDGWWLPEEENNCLGVDSFSKAVFMASNDSDESSDEELDCEDTVAEQVILADGMEFQQMSIFLRTTVFDRRCVRLFDDGLVSVFRLHIPAITNSIQLGLLERLDEVSDEDEVFAVLWVLLIAELNDLPLLSSVCMLRLTDDENELCRQFWHLHDLMAMEQPVTGMPRDGTFEQFRILIRRFEQRQGARSSLIEMVQTRQSQRRNVALSCWTPGADAPGRGSVIVWGRSRRRRTTR